MKVNVEIERTAEALDQRHRAGLRDVDGETGLGESDESQLRHTSDAFTERAREPRSNAEGALTRFVARPRRAAHQAPSAARPRRQARAPAHQD